MKYSETNINRIFVIRLEDGDRLPDVVEEFARKKGITSGCCLFLGGVKDRSEIVTGPETEDGMPPLPMHLLLTGTHEVAGVWQKRSYSDRVYPPWHRYLESAGNDNY